MRRLFLFVIYWGSMPAFLFDPFIGIVYYALNSIIRPEQLLWGSASGLGRMFLAAQALCFLSWLINKDNLNPEATPLPFQWKIMVFVALMMTIASYRTPFYPGWSWKWTIVIWTTSILCFVMIKAFNTAKKVELYYALSLIWFVLLAIWGIQQKFAGNSRMEKLGGYVLPDVNFLAAVYVLYFPMTYYMIFSRNKWVKFCVGIPSFIIFVIFILFGESRGAFLGMAVCMLLIFMRAEGTQKFKMLFTSLLVGSLLVAVLSVLAPEGFFDEYTARLGTILGKEDEFTGEVEREGSSAGRISMWKGAFFLYRTHPEYWLTGVGINSYRLMYFQNHADELRDYLNEDEFRGVAYYGSGGKDMHSAYFSLLLGGGALVFVPWLFLIFYSWLQAHQISKKYPRIVDDVDIHNYAKAVEIGIVGYCVAIAFVSMELIDFFYWHMAMAGILANLGKAALKRQELGLEEEEFSEKAVARPIYAHY